MKSRSSRMLHRVPSRPGATLPRRWLRKKKIRRYSSSSCFSSPSSSPPLSQHVGCEVLRLRPKSNVLEFAVLTQISHRRTTEDTGARQNTQEHGRTHKRHKSTAEYTGARQNTQEHNRTHRTHRSTAENTGARQNTQEHGRTHRNTAEHAGALQTIF